MVKRAYLGLGLIAAAFLVYSFAPSTILAGIQIGATLSNPSVSCNASTQACTATITVANSNQTQNEILWFAWAPTLTNTLPGGSVYLSISVTQGTSKTFTQSLGTIACGAYTLTIELFDATQSNIIAFSSHTSFNPCGPPPSQGLTQAEYLAIALGVVGVVLVVIPKGRRGG